jgi:hypothetical protein
VICKRRSTQKRSNSARETRLSLSASSSLNTSESCALETAMPRRRRPSRTSCVCERREGRRTAGMGQGGAGAPRTDKKRVGQRASRLRIAPRSSLSRGGETPANDGRVAWARAGRGAGAHREAQRPIPVRVERVEVVHGARLPAPAAPAECPRREGRNKKRKKAPPEVCFNRLGQASSRL